MALAQLDARYPLNTASPAGDLGASGSTYAAPLLNGTLNVESIIRINTLNQLAGPTTALSMSGLVGGVSTPQRITNGAPGTAPTDFALMQQLGGWIPDANAWTQTGVTTFTIAANSTSTYVKGTKVKWSQSGVAFYGVVVSSSYSSPNTTVTLVTTPDYQMTATPDAGSVYYSYSSPSDFPTKFTWTPGWTGFTTGQLPGNAASNAWWAISGGICTISFFSLQSGASNSVLTGAVAPISASATTFTAAFGLDNGATAATPINTPASVYITSGSTTLTFNKQIGTANWTASGYKTIVFEISYPL